MISKLNKLKNFFEEKNDYKNARNISRLISIANDSSADPSSTPPGPITLPGDRYYTYKYIPPGKGVSQMGGGNYFEVITDKEEDQYQRVGFLMGPSGTYDTDTGVKNSETLGWERLISGGIGQGMDEAKKNNQTPEGSIPRESPSAPVIRDTSIGDVNYTNVIDSKSVKIKQGVDLENITPAAKNFIKYLSNKFSEFKAKGLDVERPVITSGYRDHADQTKIMIRNFKNNGGIRLDKKTGVEKGKAYIENLYGEKGKVYAEILVRHTKSNTDPFQELYLEVAKVQGGHTSKPARALDLRPTKGLRQLLDSITEVKFEILDETNTAGPHYHITVIG
jgi:hypothetical protein